MYNWMLIGCISEFQCEGHPEYELNIIHLNIIVTISAMMEREQKVEQKQQGKQIEIVIDASTMLPMDTTIHLMGALSEWAITHPSVCNLYSLSSTSPTPSSSLIQPIALYSSQDSLHILVQLNRYKQWTSSQIQYQHIIQLFYKLFLESNQVNCLGQVACKKPPLYIKIESDTLYARDDRNSPLIALALDALSSEQQYVEQLNAILNINYPELKIANFKTIQEIESYYYEELYRKDSKILSISNMRRAIARGQLKYASLASKKGDTKQEGIQDVTPQLLQWIASQTGQKGRPYLIAKCSETHFCPLKFWDNLTSKFTIKGQPHSQLLILSILPHELTENCSAFPIHLAFYSEQFPTKEIYQGNATGTYIKDPTKKSVLMNLNRRTVHPLVEDECMGFSRNMLISIGRCDIVLGAYNAANLCYFPVSYSPDSEESVRNAEGLCGQKKFTLKELQICRFSPV